MLAHPPSQPGRAEQRERARMVCELHDVIAHNVSVMVVQAAAGRIAGAERADDALRAIEIAGREALAELRMMLDVVREPDEHPTPRSPQPSLHRLPALADRARAAGVMVDLDVDGVDRVPEVVGVSAYRIVQEALANVVEHAKATTAAVAVRRTPTDLFVDVTDDGSSAPPQPSGGRGLIGLRERVRLLGGELAAGPRPGGGFVVHARIPLAPPC